MRYSYLGTLLPSHSCFLGTSVLGHYSILGTPVQVTTSMLAAAENMHYIKNCFN